jgi:multicomponent Na+:H+ antiporter subunit C
VIYSLACVLILIGVYGVATSRNVVRIVVSLLIAEHGVHLLLVLIGYRDGARAPIMEPGQTAAAFAASAVDPVPQALVLTSIVIGVGMLAPLVALCLRLHERYGTFDVTRMRRLKG